MLVMSCNGKLTMTDELSLEQRFSALLANISPQNRRALAKNIGKKLAQSQRQRISQQKNPDGSSYTPRKRQIRGKKGRIKRQAMFNKLKSARFMKTRTNANQVSISFRGGNATIANVHQFGLKSRVSPQSDYKVQYAQRELLGFTDQDLEMIEDEVLEALSK